MIGSRRNILLTHTVLIALFCGFIAVGTFFDRDISDTLYMPLNTPWLIITTVGQYIPFAAFNFFDGVLFGQALSCGLSKGRKRACLIFCGYLALSTGIIGSFAVLHEECLGAFSAFSQLPEAVTVPAFAVIAMLPPFLLGISPGRKLEYDKRLVWRMIRLLIFMTALVYLLGLIKAVFSRPRYRTTLTVTEFLPWYKAYDPANTAKSKAAFFGTTKNAFESFPSGHAIMNIMCIFIFPAFSWLSPKRGRESRLFLAGLAYGLLIMLSRIILGAHFLTDVSFGALISTFVSLIYFLTEKHMEEKHNDDRNAAPAPARDDA